MARKSNPWPMRLFYGMIDSAALTEFAISAENVPSFREQMKDKRQIFLKKLALALIFHMHVRNWKCCKQHKM
jgi:hypothetical protein